MDATEYSAFLPLSNSCGLDEVGGLEFFPTASSKKAEGVLLL